MATYTDVATFEQELWPQGETVERRFVQFAADGAYAYINAALAGCYEVPFTTTPAIIKLISDMMTRTIAEWLVNRGRLPEVGDIEGEAGILSPVKLLKMLCSGELEIPGTSRLTSTGAWVSTADEMHIFDYDSPIFHQPDRDYLDTLLDQRANS